MKKFLIIVCISLVALIYTSVSCISLKRSPGGSDSSAGISSTEPLTGNWDMTRVSIEPEFPSAVPGFVIDQVFPKKATWKISSTLGHLKLDYGRSTWFNPMGLNVNVNSPTVTESSDKRSCVFSGGGSIKIDKLPGVLAFVSTIAGNIQNILINYTDKVNVSLVSQDKISATITYSASGTYNSQKGTENINYQGTITYSGVRK